LPYFLEPFYMPSDYFIDLLKHAHSRPSVCWCDIHFSVLQRELKKERGARSHLGTSYVGFARAAIRLVHVFSAHWFVTFSVYWPEREIFFFFSPPPNYPRRAFCGGFFFSGGAQSPLTYFNKSVSDKKLMSKWRAPSTWRSVAYEPWSGISSSGKRRDHKILTFANLETNLIFESTVRSGVSQGRQIV